MCEIFEYNIRHYYVYRYLYIRKHALPRKQDFFANHTK